MNTPPELLPHIRELAEELGNRHPSSCSCKNCRSCCEMVPCLGTPQDVWNLIEAGHIADLSPSIHFSGAAWDFPPIECVMIRKAPAGGCSLYKEGLCTLHERGLKPTEGRLQTCEPGNEAVFPHVAATWLLPENKELILAIFAKFDVPPPPSEGMMKAFTTLAIACRKVREKLEKRPDDIRVVLVAQKMGEMYLSGFTGGHAQAIMESLDVDGMAEMIEFSMGVLAARITKPEPIDFSQAHRPASDFVEVTPYQPTDEQKRLFSSGEASV